MLVDRSRASAYGGENWSPRSESLRDEIGSIWNSCGINSEWNELKTVLLHRPGGELDDIIDPDTVQMIDIPDRNLLKEQHNAMAQAYRDAGVDVLYLEPAEIPPPNLMFVADLVFMTPEGAILSRPASTVRAGEERVVAEGLAARGIPIIRSVSGNGTFEGADAAWIDPDTVMIGLGLRTNAEGASQVATVLNEMGVDVIPVDLPHGSMHLMGDLRFVDEDVAVCREGRTSYGAIMELRDRGFSLIFVPNSREVSENMAMNFVTLGSNKILMPKGVPATRSLLEDYGVECRVTDIDELTKAAGGIGCMSGVLERKLV